jgi:hypothetical protein
MADDRWEKVRDDNGEVYWWNPKTNESRWEEPSGVSSQEPAKPSNATGTKPPPLPKRPAAGNGSPSGNKLSSLVSAGSTLVKSNSMRLKTMVKKEEPKKEPPVAPKPATAAATSVVAGDQPPAGWEARRKKSFQAAYQAVQTVKTNLTGGEKHDPSSVSGHFVQQAKDTNRHVTEVIRDAEISEPFDVKKQLEVSFDEENIRYTGLPDNWAAEAHKQFGIPLQTCPRTQVPGYSDRIPIVLVKLKNRFTELGGMEADGIFRLAPDGQDVADAKTQINAGQALQSLERTKDPHVVANLIKQFFRELKPKVLNVLTKEAITEMSSITDLKVLGERLESLPDPQRSSYFWLLDLLCEVADKQEVNRMTPINLAIVLSPNLFDAGPDMDPFDELVLSQRVAAFTSQSVKWRIEHRKGLM